MQILLLEPKILHCTFVMSLIAETASKECSDVFWMCSWDFNFGAFPAGSRLQNGRLFACASCSHRQLQMVQEKRPTL